MTVASNLRDATYMYAGGMIGGIGIATILVGLIASFPWNVACGVIGALLMWSGSRLFLKGL